MEFLFGKIWIQKVGGIEFLNVISAAENSNKFPQKTRFWKENIS
jgi:hypothetical protein